MKVKQIKMKEIKTKNVKLTAVSEENEPLCQFTINLVGTLVNFRYDKGYTEMSAPGLRMDWIRIKEDKAHIDAALAKKEKTAKLRSTDSIVREGNTDNKLK